MAGIMKNVFWIPLLISMFNLNGCLVATDKLYIFKIDQIPTENDWANSLPYHVSVEKGKLNRNSPKISKLDKETIHASNKTCHHTGPTAAVEVKLSAFYNDNNFFLRIQWPDKNKDNVPSVWDRRTKTFDKTKGREDGLGIIWNAGKSSSCNCSANCHLNDWQVRDSRLSPICQMKSKNGESLNLWVWRAGRNTKENSIWSVNLDSTGINESEYSLQNLGGTPIIYSQSLYENGFWTLIITSPLNSSEKEFLAGNSYPFQIAVFDNTYSDHSITSEIKEMIFVKNENKNSPISPFGKGGLKGDL
ncbi:MAG: ethylbenzene dehydrogenase-related protein [bacterium]